MKDILNKIWEFILKVWRSKPVTFITIFVLMCAGIGGFVGDIVELLKLDYVTLGICHVICWAFAIGPYGQGVRLAGPAADGQ